MTTRRQARATRRRPPEQARRRSREKLQKRMVRYAAVGAVAVIGALIIVALILPSIQPGRPAPGTIPEGPGEQFSDMGATHIPQAERAAPSAYNSVPPTSGNHWPVWQKCGAHQDPVPNEMQVHNLEHGFVNIQYNTQDQAVIDKLKALAEKLPGWPNYYLVAPYPTMDYTIALTAWRVRLTLETVDEKAIRDFASAYRARGPEAGAPAC